MLNLLRRHPALGTGLDQFEVAAGQAEILKRWLEMHLPTRIQAFLGLSIAPGSYDYAQKKYINIELLQFDVQQPYEDTNQIFLEPVVWSAEVLYPGLGSHLLKVLDKVNYRVLDILTPEAVRQFAIDDMWFGESEDQAFLESYKEMNGLEDEEEQDADVVMPSDYKKSLGELYGSTRDAKAFSKAAKARAAKALRRIPWASELLKHLNRLEATFPSEGTPFAEFGSGDYGPQIRVEPSYAFWWAKGPSLMSDLYDQTFQYRMEASDTYTDCLLTVDITDVSSHNKLIETIEGALPFIKAVDDFFYFLHEGK